MAFKRWRIY